MLKAAVLLALSALLAGAQTDEASRQLSRDILRQLIEINTTDSVGDNTAAAKAMERRFLDAGFPAGDVQLLVPEGRPKKGNLVVRLRGPAQGSLKPILILGHLDVVEARREDWSTDPFQLVEKDGYFYGRGTQDMKDCDAMLVTTFLRMRSTGYRPSRDLILALTSDEEGGTANGVDWLLKNHRAAIDAEFALNADMGNVVLENGKATSVEIGAAEKLYADFELTVTNKGGHSSRPTPDNAIYELANALVRLEHAPFPFELNPVTRGYFEHLGVASKNDAMKAVLAEHPDPAAIAKLSEDTHYNALTHTTCVATRLMAGHANNALPQTAQAIVNCRILPGHSAEEIRKELVRRLADSQVAVRYVDSATGKSRDTAPAVRGVPPLAPRAEVVNPLRRIADAMWPGAALVTAMSTGASDSKYTNAAGIPSYGVGEVPIDGDDDRAHGKDERIRVSSFYAGVDFFWRFLGALGGG